MLLQTESEWIETYRSAGALWIYDGNPRRPHVKLSSGKHSNGFFNSERVMEKPYTLDSAARDLVELALQAGLDLNVVDCVAGPAMGAITLAHDLARHIDVRGAARQAVGKLECRRAYTEKLSIADDTMVFKRTTLRSHENVLPAEDVLTTGKSVNSMVNAINTAGGVAMDYIIVLVNRTGADSINGRKIVALINRPMPTWEADECPLCKQGSEAIPAKAAENWARLNAEYPAPETVAG